MTTLLTNTQTRTEAIPLTQLLSERRSLSFQQRSYCRRSRSCATTASCKTKETKSKSVGLQNGIVSVRLHYKTEITGAHVDIYTHTAYVSSAIFNRTHNKMIRIFCCALINLRRVAATSAALSAAIFGGSCTRLSLQRVPLFLRWQCSERARSTISAANVGTTSKC